MQAKVNDGERNGRGFSIAELKEAGLDPRTARKHGVPTDEWRSTKYDENIEQLKSVSASVKEQRNKKKEEKGKKTEQAPPTPRPKTAKKPTTKKKKAVKKKSKQQKKRKK